jgi:prolyl-tRNA synthetase
VGGANKVDYHLKNTNAGKDYEPDIVADIALAQAGDKCTDRDAVLQLHRGIEVGHCFKLGRRYTQSMNITYLDQNGKAHVPVMGSYGIGVGRLMAAIVEQHHDEHGIIWPDSVAPFDLHLVSLGKPDDETGQKAQEIYEELLDAGIDVLFDDRRESAGVKFADADLMGIPWRVTVSDRGLKENCVEVKRRSQPEKKMIPLDDFMDFVFAEIWG